MVNGLVIGTSYSWKEILVMVKILSCLGYGFYHRLFNSHDTNLKMLDIIFMSASKECAFFL